MNARTLRAGWPGAFISRSYARVRRSYLTKYLIPRFGALRLTEIAPAMIEEWLMGLMDAGTLTPATCNRCLGTLHIMLAQAVKMGHLAVSPASPIEQLKENPKPRGILSIETMRLLFKPETALTVWGDPRHLTINMLAASTGMRLGECQALQIQHVHFPHPAYVDVLYSWDDKYGLTRPKWDSRREIPIPEKVARSLLTLIENSPYGGSEDLVFWGRDGRHPWSKTAILAGLRRALERVGMPIEEQKRQNIVYHSHRHNFNTLIRGRVPDEQLRRVTGHRSMKMSDRYDHAGAGNLLDVLAVQEDIFN